MDISIWKIFSIFGIVSSWAAKALADNKVTLKEATDLVVSLADILGVPTELELEKPLPDSSSSLPRDEYGKTL